MPKLSELKNNNTVNFQNSSSNDIAIIGMSINLPMASNIHEFWEILSNKVNCIREFPERRRKDCDEYLNDGNVRLES
ncbi:MAG: hypothetical protein K5986_06165 [Clostridium sp.]|jgi:acyl transferase domain-containing protein|nr:hypothetical protein [Clostridium sp.]MCR4944029.1 hypothetical protein [Clostridium sp.]